MEPKSKAAAAVVFLAGLLVISVTTLDVQRQIHQNSAPVTEHQKRALEDFVEARRQRVASREPKSFLSRPAARQQRARQQASWVCAAAKPQDPYRLLQVERGSSRAEVRAAYIQQIKRLHPDVSVDEDTTEAAAALNAAYEAILQALERGELVGGGRQQRDWLDVFDLPEAPPTQVFVNPFACYNVSPLDWEQLQQVVAGAQDPEAALMRAGVGVGSGLGIVYLSPEQLRIIEEELERMTLAMDVITIEVASYFVRDCLLRARVANNRMESNNAAGRW
ncbi:hypothetical protein N2152v2_010619 [Parachlorella kessleri]